MVLRLAEQLEIPLRERNNLLLAAGYAPAFRESRLDHADLREVVQAVQLILSGHEPYPALAFDRHWTIVAANNATNRLLKVVTAELLQPPVNILRAALHPQGLAPHIQNLEEWRVYTFRRLQRQIDLTDDPVLRDLLRELSGYPHKYAGHHTPSLGQSDLSKASYIGLVVRLRLVVEGTVLSFFSASTVLGGPVDITLSELAIESFFPADQSTAHALQKLAQTGLGASKPERASDGPMEISR
jgi:hypothetical protein